MPCHLTSVRLVHLYFTSHAARPRSSPARLLLSIRKLGALLSLIGDCNELLGADALRAVRLQLADLRVQSIARPVVVRLFVPIRGCDASTIIHPRTRCRRSNPTVDGCGVVVEVATVLRLARHYRPALCYHLMLVTT